MICIDIGVSYEKKVYIVAAKMLCMVDILFLVVCIPKQLDFMHIWFVYAF